MDYSDGMNLYAFVRNNPVNFTDPLGSYIGEKYVKNTWENKSQVFWGGIRMLSGAMKVMGGASLISTGTVTTPAGGVGTLGVVGGSLLTGAGTVDFSAGLKDVYKGVVKGEKSNSLKEAAGKIVGEKHAGKAVLAWDVAGTAGSLGLAKYAQNTVNTAQATKSAASKELVDWTRKAGHGIKGALRRWGTTKVQGFTQSLNSNKMYLKAVENVGKAKEVIDSSSKIISTLQKTAAISALETASTTADVAGIGKDIKDIDGEIILDNNDGINSFKFHDEEKNEL
jgi:hypothetical protein